MKPEIPSVASVPTPQSTETQLAIMNLNLVNLQKSVDELRDSVKIINGNVAYKKDITDIEEKIRILEKENRDLRADFDTHLTDYAVEKSENHNVKKIVYGLTTLALVAVVGAILSLVILR